MKVMLKSLHLEFFKGMQDKTYNFGNHVTRILAMNGKGKTTIATAIFWLLFDKDYELNSNPIVRPVGVEECTPTVTAVFDIDGKEVSVAKIQKCKKSKPDDNGICKVSLTNTYEVNCVPLGERDFKLKMAEYGFDFDTALVCMHPSVFISQKSQDMRKVLFGMASTKSDKEIAELSAGAADVAKLLESYSLDEITAMQKASKKKAVEQTEAIPNQIIGLEKAKVEIDTAELELAKEDLQRRISGVSAKINTKSSVLEDLQGKELELQFEVNGLYSKANDALMHERRQLDDCIFEKNVQIENIKRSVEQDNKLIEQKEYDIKSAQKCIEELAEEWKQVNGKIFDRSVWVFDESSTVCSLCGQLLPNDKIETLKAEFESRVKSAEQKFDEEKASQLEEITDAGKRQRKSIDDTTVEVSELKALVEANKKELEDVEKTKAELQTKLSALPIEPDMSNDLEYQKNFSELESVRKQIVELPTVDNSSLEQEKLNLESELQTVIEKLAQAQNNINIDIQIDELQNQQRDYEQAKADAEKIIYQLDLVSKKKNELLTDEINKNFNLVKFKMFDYQKNGEYKECCIPLIDGYEFGKSTNTGREIVAKLDICAGLQMFYGMNVPVFLDNAESLNDCNIPQMDCQLIALSVSDDKELKVEV